MKNNFKFKFNPHAALAFVQRIQSYVIGLVLIGIFGYTAYVVNAALNVKQAAKPSDTIPTIAITFDKSSIDTVKHLTVVPGDVGHPPLGKDDPFGR